MANTQFLKTKVENHVRDKLKSEFGIPFEKKKLRIGTKHNGKPAWHEFDSVSRDETIVAAIKTTTWGKNPGAKPNALYVDLYFLSRVKTKKRLLILTNPETHKGFCLLSDGKEPDSVEIRLVQLPLPLQKKVDANMRVAKEEMK